MSERLTQFLYRLMRDHPEVDLSAHLAQTRHVEAIYSLPDIENAARRLGGELLAPASLELTEAQEQAQSALDKVMNCRFSNFDAGTVIGWAERGMYQLKMGATGERKSRFVAIVHRWHVHSKGFIVEEIEAASEDEAREKADALAHRLDQPFYSAAVYLLSIGNQIVVKPRRLTWRERLTGRATADASEVQR